MFLLAKWFLGRPGVPRPKKHTCSRQKLCLALPPKAAKPKNCVLVGLGAPFHFKSDLAPSWAQPNPKYPAPCPQTGTQRLRTSMAPLRRVSTTLRNLYCEIVMPGRSRQLGGRRTRRCLLKGRPADMPNYKKVDFGATGWLPETKIQLPGARL